MCRHKRLGGKLNFVAVIPAAVGAPILVDDLGFAASLRLRQRYALQDSNVLAVCQRLVQSFAIAEQALPVEKTGETRTAVVVLSLIVPSEWAEKAQIAGSGTVLAVEVGDADRAVFAAPCGTGHACFVAAEAY